MLFSKTHSLLLSICILLMPQYVAAYTPLETLPNGTRSTLLVKNISNNQIKTTTGDSEQFFPPASTLKLVTALAAKLELEDDFHYQTTLSRSADDILIHFSGDPTLTTKHLNSLIQQAKAQGVNRIDGDVWLDDSAFTGYDRAVGWPWDILGVCYSAPVSAITLDGNCVQASIYTQDNGKTRVYVPEQYPIYVSTQAKTVTKSAQKSTQCDLELLASPNNHYLLDGCLVERKKPLPLKFAVQDPSQYTKRIVSTLLNRSGIQLNGEVKVGKPPHTTHTLIAQHQSEPLPVLLNSMLKKSNNLIADSLTKSLGAHFYFQPGSFKNGTEAIKQIIFTRTGIDIDHAKLADGSGLSRNNRFTSQDMADVLHYIWQHDSELGLIDLMATSGESGTLKYRRSMRKDPIKGHIIAKSGSLYGSYNMAGYGLDKRGKPTSLFVQFVTDYHPKKRDDDKPIIAPITQFETLFYQDIVSFSQAIPKK